MTEGTGKPAGDGQDNAPQAFGGAARVTGNRAKYLARKQDRPPYRDPYECECDNCQGCAGEW